MNKNIFKWFTLYAVLSLFIIGCGGNKDSLNIREGQRFSLKLPSNPTTGYSWAIESIDYNFVEVKGSDFIPPRSGLMGAGGQEVWMFKAVKKGNTLIKMKYARPWEKKNPPGSIKVYKIKII